MFTKIRKAQDRAREILSYLGEQRALAQAYRWFLQSGRDDFAADGEKDRFNYDLTTLKLFDVLLEGGSIVAANIRTREQRKEHFRKSPHVFGTYPVDSNVSISPFFDESFLDVPRSLRGTVVDKLKELAKTTNQPATLVQKKLKKICKLKHGIPCIEVAPGLSLVVEFETVGVCFMGFLASDHVRQWQEPTKKKLPVGPSVKSPRVGNYLGAAIRWVSFLPLAFGASWLVTQFFLFFRFGNLDRFSQNNNPYVVLIFMYGVAIFMQGLSGTVLGWVGVKVAPAAKTFALVCCVAVSSLIAIAYFLKFNDLLGGIAALTHIVATAVAGYRARDD